MFKRRDVFTEDFLPNEFPGRGQELGALSEILKPVTRDEPAQSCWEFGPAGVGKTSTARFLLDKLHYDHGLDYTLVECLGASRWEIICEIAMEHPGVPAHNGMGVEQLLTEIEDAIDEPYVVILDEVDGLEHPEVFIDLYGLEQLSLICIGHDPEDLISYVPDAADGLRYCRQVEFEPYSVGAMYDILQARVDPGLQPNAIDSRQLERIADEVAGSARFGVQALRSAVEIGVDRGHTQVHKEDVDDCFDHAQSRIREDLLDSLSRQHLLVYQVIRDAGGDGLRPSEILEEYQRRSSDPRSRQMVTRYRKKLKRYGLVACEGDGSSKWHHWWAIDEQLAAPLREDRAPA